MDDRYLFRAKRINNGEWAVGNLIIDESRGNEYQYRIQPVKSAQFYAYPIDPSTICQCTGLKDKNGNMVFENDIMSAHLDDCFPEDITYARVIWGDTGYCLREKDSMDIQPLEEIDMEYFTACGNVFDNPELLEQEG